MGLFDFLKKKKTSEDKNEAPEKVKSEKSEGIEGRKLKEIFPRLKGIDFNKVEEKVFSPHTLKDDMKGKWYFGCSTIFILYQIYDNDDYEDDINELLKLNNILFINHEINNSGAVIWEGDGFKIELLKTKNVPYSIAFITNDDIVNVGLTKIINLKHIEGIKLNWIYGIDEVYEYETLDREFHTHNVPLYWKDSEDDVESIFIKTINKRIAFSLIDQIIEENGGKDKFKSLRNIEKWENLYEGDIFHIGYLTDNECIRINKQNIKINHSNEWHITDNEKYWIDLINIRVNAMPININSDDKTYFLKLEGLGRDHGEEYKYGENSIPNDKRNQVALDRIEGLLSIRDFIQSEGSIEQKFHLDASIVGALLYAFSIGEKIYGDLHKFKSQAIKMNSELVTNLFDKIGNN